MNTTHRNEDGLVEMPKGQFVEAFRTFHAANEHRDLALEEWISLALMFGIQIGWDEKEKSIS